LKRSWCYLFCLLLALTLAAPHASAVRIGPSDCAHDSPPDCITQVTGTIQTGTGTVTIPTQFVPSANPQQPDTFWYNSPGEPQNLTVAAPGLDLSGFVTFVADPWFSYDLTFQNNTANPMTIDLSWTPSAADAPFYWGSASFQATVSGAGTVSPTGLSPNPTAMQTVSYPGGTPLLLGMLPCGGACAQEDAIEWWEPAGLSFPSYTVALDFTLAPNTTAEMDGFEGLNTPEPGGVQLLGIGLLALGLGRRYLRRPLR